MIYWLMLTLAAAADPYTACCKASGAASCPTSLIAAGPDTQATPTANTWNTKGLWELSCAGGVFFDPNAVQQRTREPALGELLTPITSSALTCFEVHCPLPNSLCLNHEGGKASVVTCGSTQPPLQRSAWTSTPTKKGTVAVLLRGRVISALPSMATGASQASSATVYGAGEQRTVASHQVTDGAVTRRSADTKLPPAPQLPCRPNMATRDASNAQVDEGNEAVITGDWNLAMNKYRAAVTLNNCNAFAWASLGDALIQLGEPKKAIPALQAATALMPKHYQAWTRLGQAAEETGATSVAHQAFQKAVDLKPDHGPALEGLGRTAGR